MGLYDGIYLFTDMDGTLLDDDKQIPESNIKALRRFTSQGGHIGLASGRTPHNFSESFARLPLNSPSLLYNGAAIYDTVSGEYLHCLYPDRYATRQLICDVLELFPDASIQVCTRERIYQANLNAARWVDPLAVKEGIPECPTQIEDMQGDWIKVIFCYPEEKMAPAIRQISQKPYISHFSCINSGDIYYEFLHPSVNKGSALHTFRRLMGNRIKKILAIGDYYNDIEMLTAADAACAPANAQDAVKAVCKYLACSCNSGAVADFLEQAVFSGREL